MKPVYLELCGVNSFSERAEINFNNLLEYGIFGIFGDTGSGKSTILDCICFALYGRVSRLDSKEAVIANMINYNSDRAYVNFEFEIVYENKRRTYRVEREVKRKNGSQTVHLYEKTEGNYTALAEGTRDANAALEKIIGLEQKDFEKCIALPQGEFAQFVKSAKSDRLKLISRLFNLDCYGEGLVKRTNARYNETKSEAEILKTRLEPYENVSEEIIKEYKKQISHLKESEKKAETIYAAARENEKRLSALMEKRLEAQKTVREMQKLEEIREDMSALNGELERLEKADAVCVAAREVSLAEEKAKRSEAAFKESCENLSKAEESVTAVSAWDFEKANTEIVRLTALISEAKNVEADAKARAEAEHRLEKIQSDLNVERDCFKDFSYDEERNAAMKELKRLDKIDFLSYAEEHGKAGLLRAEYAEFAGELKKLTEMHPIISPDSVPIIQRYRKLAEGEKMDFARIREEYEEIEKRRTELRDKLVQLEKIKGKYEVHLARLSQLEAERKQVKERLEELATRLQGGTIGVKEIEKNLKELQTTQKKNTEMRDRAREQLAAAQANYAAAEERMKGASERFKEAKERLTAALESGGFKREKDALVLSEKYGNPAEAKLRVEQYKEMYAATRAKCREYAKLDFSEISEGKLQAVKEELVTAENSVKEHARQIALAVSALERAEQDISMKKTLSKEYEEKRKEAERYERLKKLLDGNKFMEFVAEEYLQTVASNASGRLLTLTDGRYFLRYEGNFIVGDNLCGGAPRGVYTLSGGETFLVSLSLALALSAEICARSLRPVEFFFLDEGFGTLDEKLVDTVMDSLEKLKGEHFSIGIISHVEELRHRIERKLFVKKATDTHGSQITME
ncbi:MAG: SMC family ATPase [Clostridia bacterium]|nr:SMC family ATPase [Clostridia bacterium]